MKRHAWSIAATATLLVAIAVAGLSSLAAGRFAWGPPEKPKAQGEAIRPDSSSPGVKDLAALRYQDRVVTAIVREPQNTWSNLAFVFVGAWIAARDRRIFSRFLGAAFVALGLASGVYHASLLPAWRTVDVAMMGWAVFALGLMGLSAVRSSRPAAKPLWGGRAAAQFWLSTVGGSLAILAAVFRNDVRVAGVKPFDSTYMTVAGVAVVSLLLLGGIVFASKSPSLPRIGLVVGVTIAAILCQWGDHPGSFFFRPDSVIQAHAIWHLLMAAVVALAYDTFAFIERQPKLTNSTN